MEYRTNRKRDESGFLYQDKAVHPDKNYLRECLQKTHLLAEGYYMGFNEKTQQPHEGHLQHGHTYRLREKLYNDTVFVRKQEEIK